MSEQAAGKAPYTRYQGAFATGSRLGVVFEGEVQRVIRSTWGLVALMGGIALGVAYIMSLLTTRQTTDAHTLAPYMEMMGLLPWAGLAVAAITGTTTLLLDKQHGALDLYFTRSLTPGEYLAGKCLAQFALSGGVVFVPVLVYVLMAHVLFSVHPEGWGMAIPVAFAVATAWGLLVTGLALGVSVVGRSASGAVVVLAGAFLVVEVILWRLVGALTDSAYVALISPIQGMRQITAWLMGQPLPHEFGVEWAVAVWLILVLFGWGMLFWRRPRVKGIEGVKA
jgi:ABC-type transport system involved in multi-copper enzyme maturation permease subunit